MANKKALRERERQNLEHQERLREQFRSSDARSIKAVISPEYIGQLVYSHFALKRNALRGPETFNRSLKTRDHDRIALAYLLHMYTDYKVPQHIQQVWLDTKLGSYLVREDGKARERKGNTYAYQYDREPNPTVPQHAHRRAAFFIVGQGKSLFKELLKDKGLSKKEVHTFLTCPHDISFDEALVYAMAKSFTDNNGLALKLARTRVARGDFPSMRIGHPFFRETIRFFAQHELALKEINDLCDYIFRRATMTEDNKFNDQWSYRGRSVAALQKQMNDWHYELRRMASIGGGTWDGLPIADKTYSKIRARCQTTNRDKFVDWRMEQIKTGNDLAKEGTAMHHCVASYKQSCIAGHTGIFSLKASDHNAGCWSRALTIEVTSRASYYDKKADGPMRISQIRGFANRTAKPEELAIVRRWADEYNLDMTRYY